jgi:hypothetical protein
MNSCYFVDISMKEPLTILKVKKISHGLIELRCDNILTFRPDVASFKNYDLQVLQDLLEAFIEITDGTPRPYMCDNRYVTGIVNKEEQAYMNKHFGSFATKAAMITHSPIIKVLLNSYNYVFKPKIQLKLFISEDEAVKWLLSN